MSAAAFWQTLGGIAAGLGILGVLARISFQLGSLVAELKAYRRTNDRAVSELVRKVERLDRHARGRWG
jgi:hypothetical protein